MSFLTGIEEDFILGDLKVYREFDISHFVSNAKTAITGKPDAVQLDIKFDYYSSMLEKAIEHFKNISVDTSKMKGYFDGFSGNDKLDSANMSMRDVDSMDVITIRPQYISQYTSFVGTAIDKVMEGYDAPLAILSGELIHKTKRNVVKTTLPVVNSNKDLLAISNSKPITVTSDYVKSSVAPFASKASNIQKETLVEAIATLNAIKETENTMKSMINVINKKKEDGNLNSDILNKLNKLSYNSIRGIIDIISYTTYMTIRKLNIVGSNILACDSLHTDIENLESTTTEGAMDSIIPRDTNSIAEEFIAGNIGAFEDLATNIYEFHSSIPNADAADLLDQGDETVKTSEIDQADFDSKIYKEAYKIFDSINGGLDTIAAASDEYMMVFDDIIKEAGFELTLEDRYRTYIEGIDDLSVYRGTANDSNSGASDKVMYKRILLEVKQFPELIKNIAEICQETKQKADMLIKRFSSNINGEYKDAQSVNELKIFLSDLTDQYNTLTRLVCGKFMHRLLELGNILTQLEANDSENNIVPDVTPIDTDSNIDFSEGMIDELATEYENETLDILNHLEIQLYSEMVKLKTGKEVVLEAPDPNSPTATPAKTPAQQPQQSTNAQTPQPSTTNATGNNADTAGKTDVVVQDNDVQPGQAGTQPNGQNNQPQPNTGTAPQANTTATPSTTNPTGGDDPNQPKDISAKYHSAADRFLKSMSRKTGGSIQAPTTESVVTTEANNADWLAKNEDELASRVYSNVSVQRVDTDVTNEKRIQDLEKIAQNIDMLASNPGGLQSIKSEEDAARKVAPMISSLNTNDDIKKQMRNYYRTGSTSDPQPTSIANSELKNHVNNKIIPRVKAFHDRNAQGLADAAKKVGASMSKLKQAISGNQTTTVQQNGTPISTTITPTTGAVPVAASADFSYMGYSIYEDENTANPPQTDPNTNANTKTNLNQVVRMIDKIAGAAESQALNAAYDEYNDDMKALNALVPKSSGVKEKSAATANTVPQANPQPTTPVTASTDVDIIKDGELYTAEEYLESIIDDINNSEDGKAGYISSNKGARGIKKEIKDVKKSDLSNEEKVERLRKLLQKNRELYNMMESAPVSKISRALRAYKTTQNVMLGSIITASVLTLPDSIKAGVKAAVTNSKKPLEDNAEFASKVSKNAAVTGTVAGAGVAAAKALTKEDENQIRREIRKSLDKQAAQIRKLIKKYER